MSKLFVKAPEGVKMVKHAVDNGTMWTIPGTPDCNCNRLLVAYAKNGKIVWTKNGYSS